MPEQKKNKCVHSIQWDDDSLHRPNPNTDDLLVVIGQCEHCGWDFKKQYMHDVEIKHDPILNLGMPYDLSVYDQTMTNIRVVPYGRLVPFYDLKKGTLK